MPPSRSRRALVLVCAVLIAVAWFAWLRPASLGGSAAYVVVQGGSMEPTYQDGDLILIREAGTYREGDIIAFRAGGSFDDPTRIIHRIVGDTGEGTFKTQGDNRPGLDPWTPGPDDIIGKASVHIPQAGAVAGLLTNPATFAALGGAAVVVGGERRRRRRHPPQHPRQEAAHMKPIKPNDPAGAPTRPVVEAPTRLARLTHPRWAFFGLVATSLIALPLLAITWSALRAPDSTQRIERVGQLDYGIGLEYRFSGAASAVYPTGEVGSTGTAAGAIVADDPLYSRLLDDLEVELTFRVDAEGADDLAGTYGVDVVIETPSGWSAPIQSIEATTFDGAATEALTIDLDAVALQVRAVAQLTEVGGEAYTINVVPSLGLTGTTDAGAVQEQLSAPMSFAVEDNLITANAVEAAETQELTRSVNERATYSVGPFEMGTQAARALLGGLTLVLVAGLAWFASVLFGGLGLGEPERIAARYRSQIIDVAEAAAPPGPVVMVSAIDELARIAKVEQTVILHEDLGDGAHRYRVFLGTVTYEFETAPEHGGSVTEPTAADADETGG